MDRTTLTARGERALIAAQSLGLALAFWAGLWALLSLLGALEEAAR